MRTNKVLATAAAAAVAVIAVTGGTVASAAAASPSPSTGKGSPSSTVGSKPGTPGKDRDQEAFLREIAAGLHVSLATLENALRDMKMTSGQLGVDPTDPRVVAVFAKDLNITNTKALEVIKEIVGHPGPVKSPPGGKTPPPSKSPTPAPSGKA